MRKFKRFGITAGMSLIAALSAATTVSAKNLSEFSDTNNNYTRGLYYDAAYGESYDTKDKSRPYTTSLINNVNNELSCDEAEEALIRCEVVSADSAYDDLELYNQANISLDNGHKIYDLYCLIQKNVFCFFSNKEQNRVFKNGFVVLDDLFDSNTVTVVCMCSEQEYEDFKELRDDKNLANASLYGRSSSDRYMCNYSNGILTYVEYYDKKDSYNAPEAEIDDTEIDYSNIDEETLNDPDFIDKFSETHPDSLPLSGLDVNVHYSDNKVVKKFNKCAITDVEEECFDENVSAFAEEYLDQGHKLYNLNMLTRENVFNFFSNIKQDCVFVDGFVVTDERVNKAPIIVVCRCTEQEYEDFLQLYDEENLANIMIPNYTSTNYTNVQYDSENQVLRYIEANSSEELEELINEY